jgi:hypothetical protein
MLYTARRPPFYVCAVCKSYVYQLKNYPSRIVCERLGCIDIDLRISNFCLENVMKIVMKMLTDHRAHCERENGGQNGGRTYCQYDKSIKLCVRALSEVGICEDGDPKFK